MPRYGKRNLVWTEKMLQDIEKLYMNGMSMARIGRKYDCSGVTIKARLKEYGTI